MKKIVVLLVLLLICIPTLGIYAQDSTSKPTIVLEGDVSEIPENFINEIIDEIKKDHPEAGSITIYEYKDARPVDVAEEVLSLDKKIDGFINNIIGKKIVSQTVTTQKIVSEKKKLALEKSVISIEKNNTRTLKEDLKEKVSSTYLGDSFSKSQLGAGSSLSKVIAKDYIFRGPETDSIFSHREYKIRFFNEEGFYIQNKKITYNIGKPDELTANGSYKTPTSYIFYSIDLP